MPKGMGLCFFTCTAYCARHGSEAAYALLMLLRLEPAVPGSGVYQRDTAAPKVERDLSCRNCRVRYLS